MSCGLKMQIFVSLVLVAVFDHALGQPEVDTDYGTVRGVRHQDDSGRVYDTFFGIPYATPPVGELRWQKPLPPEPWDGVREAEEYGDHCVHITSANLPQYGLSNVTSEDCLYLNVFVPRGVDEADDQPVMVYVHGGAYFLGTGAFYAGEELALHGDVIVVTINYRLSTLGWLSTGNDISPGNYGLWDTRAAVAWVRDNIASFGGDPEKITIFGQSAGGGMVSHCSVTPHMEDLFHRTIAISGGSSGFIGVAYNVSARESTKMLGRVFGCDAEDDMQAIVDCLMEEEAEDLDFWGVVGVIAFRRQLPNWIPVIDGDFVPQHPSELFDQGNADHLDFMSGRTYHDSAGFVLLDFGTGSDFADSGGLASTNETLDRALDFVLNVYGNPEEMKHVIYDEYPDMLSEDNLTRVLSTTEMSTDWWFSAPAHYEIARHSRDLGEYGKNSYLYQFHHRQSFHRYPDWVESSHSDDLYSLFGETYVEEWRLDVLGEFDDVDLTTSSHLMSYYTNFAHTGDPNEGPNEVPAYWSTYDEDSREYMVLNDAPYVAVETEEMVDTYTYWAEVWPTLVEEAGEDEIPLPTAPTITLPTPTLPSPPEADLDDMDWDTFEKALARGVMLVKSSLEVMFNHDSTTWADVETYIERVVARREERIKARHPN